MNARQRRKQRRGEAVEAPLIANPILEELKRCMVQALTTKPVPSLIIMRFAPFKELVKANDELTRQGYFEVKSE